MARAVTKASDILFLDELLGECFCLSPPSRCSSFYSIPVSPSSLPFPRCFLSISSSPLFPCLSLHLVSLPPCSLTFLGLLPFVTYVHVLSHRAHFPRFLFPSLPQKYSSCFRLLAPFISLPLSLSFFPSPPLPNFWRL